MDLVPVGLAVLAFVAGLWFSAARVPPLRRTRTGRIATRAVELLLGSAAAVLVVEVYALVRTFDLGDDTTIARDISNILWSPASLIGLAAIVHLLAPGFEEDDD